MENNCATFVDGAVGATDAATSALTKTATQLRLGYYITAADLNGHIAEIVYWDERLDDNTLASLSDGTLLPEGVSGGLILRRNRIMKRRAKARRLGLTRIRRGRPMKY